MSGSADGDEARGPGLRFALEGGGAASLVELTGEHVALLADRAFPPGAPLVATHPDLAPLRVKVRGSRRTGSVPELPFRVEGRIVELRRDERARLLAAISADHGGGGAEAPGDPDAPRP
ncbi:MAG: hypothetical protein FJ104_16645 [Deltaproteobacteria bacterium]|nr:hypothetical protein [Deltaproteobacteria bacterium]